MKCIHIRLGIHTHIWKVTPNLWKRNLDLKDLWMPLLFVEITTLHMWLKVCLLLHDMWLMSYWSYSPCFQMYLIVCIQVKPFMKWTWRQLLESPLKMAPSPSSSMWMLLCVGKVESRCLLATISTALRAPWSCEAPKPFLTRRGCPQICLDVTTRGGLRAIQKSGLIPSTGETAKADNSIHHLPDQMYKPRESHIAALPVFLNAVFMCVLLPLIVLLCSYPLNNTKCIKCFPCHCGLGWVLNISNSLFSLLWTGEKKIVSCGFTNKPEWHNLLCCFVYPHHS